MLSALYRRIDVDGSGYITNEEFTHAIVSSPLVWSKAERYVWQVFTPFTILTFVCVHREELLGGYLDQNNDGRISFSEFIAITLPQPSQSPQGSFKRRNRKMSVELVTQLQSEAAQTPTPANRVVGSDAYLEPPVPQSKKLTDSADS